MSHMIDETTGQAAIAYVGETPWHELGQAMQPDMSIAEWCKAAGLDWRVMRAGVLYRALGDTCAMTGRDVLFRSDTHAPLSVVSTAYKEVQPKEIMDFFGELAELGGFQLETAGALSGGKRIWALAKVNDGEQVTRGDFVLPYVLLATSYDGTLATTAKFTSVRVVCHNTITCAMGEDSRTVRIPHSTKFDARRIKSELGLVHNAFELFMKQATSLQNIELGIEGADTLTQKLLEPMSRAEVRDLRQAKGYKRIMDLFRGEALGADMAGQTKWGWLNAVTQMVDWERGRSADTRMTSAWFGTGDGLKSKALELALENA